MKFHRMTRSAAASALLLSLCLPFSGASAAAYEVTEKLREDMPPFRFTLEYSQFSYDAQQRGQRDYTQEGDFFYIHSISVTSAEGGALLQRIELNPPAETCDDERFGFVLEDMNFDGFLDMRVSQFMSAGTNIPYHCFLWDPAGGAFVYNEALSAVPSPIFEPQGKLVTGFERVSASEYIETTYAYDPGGALTPIGRITTGYDYDSGVMITTIEHLIDGQLQVTDIRKERFLDGTLPEAE